MTFDLQGLRDLPEVDLDEELSARLDLAQPSFRRQCQ